MKLARCLISIILLLLSQKTTAQYYTYGQDAFSQKWRQLHSRNFRLIYPEKWEAQAHGLASLLDSITNPLSRSLKSNPRKIPVVLRNQTMLSNGFVMWAPKRMELITTTPFDNQATPWLKYLAVHEFRHVVQVEALNVSTTGFFSKMFGQHITGAVLGMHLPLWFLEGDAVLAETSFSKSGRGRQPSFYMPLAAQLIEKGSFSYDKAALGSYRDMVPNHYILGYHLVAKTQSEFGFSPFQRALNQVAKTPFLPRSFSNGVKRETGKSLKQIYDAAMTDLRHDWEVVFEPVPVNDFHSLTGKSRFDYVTYYSPHFIDDDNVIACRTSPSDIPRVVKLSADGMEKVLFSPGFGFYQSLSYANGLAAWTEIRKDPRWQFRTYTNIRVLDLNSGKTHLIGKNARWQSPKLSPCGTKIAAIEVDELNNWRLVVLNTADGAEIISFTDETIGFLSEPCWDSNGDAIVAVSHREKTGKSLVSIELDSPKAKILFDAGFVEISRPWVHDSLIWFTGAWSGRDEIYAWSFHSSQLYSAIVTKTGAKDGVVSGDGNSIVFLNLTANGYQVAVAKTHQLVRVDKNKILDKSLKLYDRAIREENFLVDGLSPADTAFESKNFSKLLNLFHYHSWVPGSLDVEAMTAKPGISFFSQDLLGTTVFAGGYEFEPERAGHMVFADLALKMFYPVIDLRIEGGAENRSYKAQDQSTIKLRTQIQKITGAISLPLSYNRHFMIYGVVPRISTSQEFSSYTYKDIKYDRSLQTFSYRMSLYAYRRMAYRDLHPRLGFSTSAQFAHTPFAGDNTSPRIDAGHLKAFEISLFLPGLMRHHSFRFYTGIQDRKRVRTYFNDMIRFARGYQTTPRNKLTTISASYTLPLWYPDLSLGSLVYAKRLRANLFYDMSYSPVDGGETTWSSIGLDLLVDLHLLRMPMPFNMGVRTINRLNDGTLSFQLISTVDFYAIGRALGFERSIPLAY